MVQLAPGHTAPRLGRRSPLRTPIGLGYPFVGEGSLYWKVSVTDFAAQASCLKCPRAKQGIPGQNRSLGLSV